VAFLADEGDLRPADLAEVLRADQRNQWRAGARVPAEWYFERFPVLWDDLDLALDLIHHEFLLRETLGEPAELEEYVARFPRLAESITVQVSFHRALEDAGRTRDGDERRGGEERGREASGWAAPAAGPKTAAPPPRKDHPEIAGYQIVRKLGTGGMAVVYEAHQHGLNRRVAVKMGLGGAQPDGDHLLRFQIEAEAVASLNHPNIVEIYEIGVAEGLPYFSMELVEGGTLADEIAQGPVSARKAAQIAEVLARAIHFAHERGIIHRDLKPANVLRTPEGVPKIADFGLAKDLGKMSAHTQSGTILGSPCYMSPEQASGSVRDVGPTSDVYSLGAILYEMLVGAPPFRAETPLETLRKLLNEEPARPSRLKPKVPRDLETVCLKSWRSRPAAAMARRWNWPKTSTGS